MRRPTANFIVLSVLMLLHGCYMISDPDIWPRDFVQKNILPEMIGKTEAEVLEAFGPPKYVLIESKTNSYVYEKVEDDRAIMMIGYVPFPLIGKGHERSCVLLVFNHDGILEEFKTDSIGAASGDPHCCVEVLHIWNFHTKLNWCLYESIGHNENVMAIDVVKEYEWYELQKSKGPSLLQRLCSAADHGHPNAQGEVGRYHLQALNGMPKDLTRAYVWYSLAAGSGCFTFSSELDEIKQGLTLEQISQAEEQLKNWRPGLCEHELIFDSTGYRYRVMP